MNSPATTQQTMLSTEIVKIINDMREDGAAVLRHNDFMAKIVKVLGDEPAKNFASQYNAGNGQMQPCYALPKREANLMVMSESYKVQAAVYDKMVELKLKHINNPGLVMLIDNVDSDSFISFFGDTGYFPKMLLPRLIDWLDKNGIPRREGKGTAQLMQIRASESCGFKVMFVSKHDDDNHTMNEALKPLIFEFLKTI